MKLILKTYSSHFSNKNFVWSFVASFVLLIISLFVNFYAGSYATRVASSPVTDIILSNIPTFNVDDIFIYGPWIFWIFIALVTIAKPHRIPFMVKNIALFVFIRSFFITLTHIGPFPTSILVSSTKLATDFTFGGDLFFSAHTGLPFLMALVFWKQKILRYIMLATSVLFGVVVLLGHLHYTIDVFAAFFITYSIYAIACKFFKKDEQYFNEGFEQMT